MVIKKNGDPVPDKQAPYSLMQQTIARKSVKKEKNEEDLLISEEYLVTQEEFFSYFLKIFINIVESLEMLKIIL